MDEDYTMDRRIVVALIPLFLVIKTFCFRLHVYTFDVDSLNIAAPEVYEDAQAKWADEFGPLAQYGWGPSVHAEKWNGRHAMFGWFFICATAYAKGHGLIPDMDVPLDLKEWGTLATITGKGTITNGRAVVLIANVHFFAVSLMATICPLPFGDALLLNPDDEAPANTGGYGYMPEFKTGLTEQAEIINGRLAMLGIISLVIATAIEQKPMLDIVNEWTGGFYY